MKETYSVLLADDSEDDRYFLKAAIAEARARFQIVAEVSTGNELIAYLGGKAAYANREKYPFPDVVIMDWKMPGADGGDVLKWLQQNPFPDLKVTVFSDPFVTTPERAIGLGASCFIPKTIIAAEWHDFARKLEAHCFKPKQENRV